GGVEEDRGCAAGGHGVAAVEAVVGVRFEGGSRGILDDYGTIPWIISEVKIIFVDGHVAVGVVGRRSAADERVFVLGIGTPVLGRAAGGDAAPVAQGVEGPPLLARRAPGDGGVAA